MAQRSGKGRGATSRAASSVVTWLDEHPIPKLIGICWLVVGSVWSAYDSYDRRQVEADRAGLTYEPSTVFSSGGRTSSLINSGTRALAEATIAWQYHIFDVEPCAPSISVGRNLLKPAAEAHELLPRGELKAEFPGDVLESLCTVHGKGRVIVEWTAQYYRPADLKRYEKARYAFVEDNCTAVTPVDSLYTVQNDVLLWKDEDHRNAWRCFAGFRNSRPDITQDDFEATKERLQRLLESDRRDKR